MIYETQTTLNYINKQTINKLYCKNRNNNYHESYSII